MSRVLPPSLTQKIEELKKYFKFYPNFPKKGICFWDIFALYQNLESSHLLNSILLDYAEIQKGQIDVVVAIESRGFLFGPQLACSLDCTFTVVRKKGKLPGKVKQISYSLEYGTDILEIQEDSVKPGQRVLIVDDCIATGGTLVATSKLIEDLGAVVIECLVLYTIPGLNGTKNMNVPITSLCS